MPNAKVGRDAIELDIYGMEGVPQTLIETRWQGYQARKMMKLNAEEEAKEAEGLGAETEFGMTTGAVPAESVKLVYPDDVVSVVSATQEEKRACLAKYRFSAPVSLSYEDRMTNIFNPS